MSKLEKSVYTVEDIQQLLGIGRRQAYNLVNFKPFPVHRVGKVIRIPRKGFENWLNSGDSDKCKTVDISAQS